MKGNEMKKLTRGKIREGSDTGTKLLSNKMLTEKSPKQQTRTPIAQYYIAKMESAAKVTK